MRVAFLFAHHDRELAFKNLGWMAEQGVGSGHEIILVCPSGVSADDAQKALSLAEEGFDEASLCHLSDDCNTGWPFGPNFMFRRTVDYVAYYNLWPILLMESDSWAPDIGRTGQDSGGIRGGTEGGESGSLATSNGRANPIVST
jgi:rhodanese-related sulfurtransferase